MKKLLQQRNLVRRNIVTLIGFGLFFYFSYHLVLGNRSAMRYLTLQQSITAVEAKTQELEKERGELEVKVSMLRPGSVNKDLLEERARLVLGLRRQGEVDVMMEDTSPPVKSTP